MSPKGLRSGSEVVRARRRRLFITAENPWDRVEELMPRTGEEMATMLSGIET